MNKQAPKGQRPNTRSLAARTFRDKKNQQQPSRPLAIKPVTKKPIKGKSQPKGAIQIEPAIVQQTNLREKSEEETKATEEETLSRNTQGDIMSTRCQELVEYGGDIWEYMTKREEEWRVDACYLRQHRVLTGRLRGYLVRQMFKTCRKFDLARGTLHLAVLYMDLFFSQRWLFDNQLETVEVANACLLMAMKWEEIYPPEIDEWLDEKQINAVLKREAEVVASLGWQLGHYTPRHFHDMMMWRRRQSKPHLRSALRTDLLLDLSLFDLHMRQFPAYELARVLQILGEGQKWGNSDEKLVLACKWMVQRNSESLSWLLDRHYPSLAPECLS